MKKPSVDTPYEDSWADKMRRKELKCPALPLYPITIFNFREHCTRKVRWK